MSFFEKSCCKDACGCESKPLENSGTPKTYTQKIKVGLKLLPRIVAGMLWFPYEYEENLFDIGQRHKDVPESETVFVPGVAAPTELLLK